MKPLRVDLVKDAQDKVRRIQANLYATQSRQKKYEYHKVRYTTFQTGENVFLMVSPVKWVVRFGKKGKISSRCIRRFEILDCVGPVSYRLAFLPNLSRVHLIFHVSILKRYFGDTDYIIKWDSVLLDKDLRYDNEHIVIVTMMSTS